MSISLPAFKKFSYFEGDTCEQVNKCVFAGGIGGLLVKSMLPVFVFGLDEIMTRGLGELCEMTPGPHIPQWVLERGSRMVVEDLQSPVLLAHSP